MITVCMLTHNRLDKVKACVQSILPAIEYAADLHVLDNASTDGTALWLALMAGRIEHMKFWGSNQNTYAIGGRLRQVDRLLGDGLAWTDTVVFLDSDVIAANPYEEGDNWLERLIAPLDDPHIGISGAYGRDLDRDWTGFRVPDKLPGRVDVVAGGMTAIKGAVFLSGVEFDQAYLPFWHCDSDLCLQARMAGFEVHCTGDVGLVHEAEHKNTDEQYYKNLRRLRDKWGGKKLIRAEREPVKITLESIKA